MNWGLYHKICTTVVLLLSFVLLANVGYAFSNEDVKVNSPVFVKGKTDVVITVFNNSSVEKELTLDFIGPDWLEYEFIKYPDVIKAKRSETFKLRLNPNESELLGKQYNATLVVTLGNEDVKKELSLYFLSSAPAIEPPKETPPADIDNTKPLVVLTLPEVELAVNIVLLIIIVVLIITLIRNVRK